MVLLDAANGKDVTGSIEEVTASVFGKDLDPPKLARHLSMLPDVIEVCAPLTAIAADFASLNEERMRYFGK